MKKLLLLTLLCLAGCNIQLISDHDGGWSIVIPWPDAGVAGAPAGDGGSGGLGGTVSGTGGSSGKSGAGGVGGSAQGGKGGVSGSVSGMGGVGGVSGKGGAGGVKAGTGGSGGVSGTPAPVTSGFSIGTQSWFVASWAGENLFETNAKFTATAGAEIINPAYIKDLAGYTTFRHMDSNATNCQDNVVTWAQRKLPTNADQTAYGACDSDSKRVAGIAVEYQIALCNAASVNCWFTVGHKTNEDYWTQEANLIKARLNPNLKVYIEYSNEVWNGGFSQHVYSKQQGAAEGLPGADEWRVGQAYAMYKTLKLGKVFEDILGTARVTVVFAESGDYSLGTAALQSVYKSTKWNPNNVKIDMLAIAPYIYTGPENEMDGSTFTLAGWKAAVDKYASAPSGNNQDTIQKAAADAKANGIPVLGCYESGSHYRINANVAATNPQMYDGYLYMYDTWAKWFTGPCMHYTLHSEYTTNNAWGATSNTGASTAGFPKARAISDWIKAH